MPGVSDQAWMKSVRRFTLWSLLVPVVFFAGCVSLETHSIHSYSSVPIGPSTSPDDPGTPSCEASETRKPLGLLKRTSTKPEKPATDELGTQAIR